MATAFGDEDIRKIARLAHLELTPDEVVLFTRQLADILGYVEALHAVDTTGVPPTSHPVLAPAVWRADEPRPSLDRDEVLGRAPDASVRAGFFKVPKVL
jgi:aspartyl-tRNA(Asn)/glutamyl-tRNA(Gln) amidotransferase subunit C